MDDMAVLGNMTPFEERRTGRAERSLPFRVPLKVALCALCSFSPGEGFLLLLDISGHTSPDPEA